MTHLPEAHPASLPASHAHEQGVPNFNRLAPLYRWMELVTFGPFLHRARTAFLPRFTQVRQAIVLGDGDGRFTAALLAANPDIRIDAVDASPAMLRALARRAGRHAARLRTHIADIRHWTPTPTPPAGLIVTHFFLDCLTTSEIQSLATRLRAAAAPRALWVLSDFAIPPSLFGRLIAAPVVWSLYVAFAVLTGLRVRRLPDHSAALRRAGFALQCRRTSLASLLISELWQLGPDPTAQAPPGA